MEMDRGSSEQAGLVSLQPVGGIAGDMFCACLLDARPDLAAHVTRAVAALDLGHGIAPRAEAATQGALCGMRFRVMAGGQEHRPHDPHHDHHHHHHTAWRDIRARLTQAPLAPGIGRHALGIFGLLAEAEAAVHGVAPEDVTFHEVGAIDSIVDIAAAAALIDGIGTAEWEVGPLPRGAGMVDTQHGLLPVPAPATARLLAGFALVDDGIGGERVTPTGAAILAWLRPRQRPDGLARRLLGCGNGFGTRSLPDRPNLLRALLFAPAESAAQGTVSVLRFEVDDQSGEDLAEGLAALRRLPGVLDVCSWAAMGKKGRHAMAVQVLARPEAEAEAVEAVFTETTTLGVRIDRPRRVTLPRRQVHTAEGEAKVALRPGGRRTAKLEADALAGQPGAAARAERRARATRAALARGDGDDGA